jgi:hypothetical protein
MADEVARLNIPEYDRSDVLPCFLSWASASSIAASHAISSLPNPQLDKYRTVVGELIPDGFVGLPIGDLALLPVQRPFGTVVDVHIVHIRI